MSFASLPSRSASMSNAITLASQSSALISEVLNSFELSTVSYPISLAKFVHYVRQQWQSRSALLVLSSFETRKDISPLSTVVKASMGTFGHVFNVFTILLPGGRTTHIRVDYWAEPPPGADSRLVVSLSDDHGTLTAGSELVSRITAPTVSPLSNPPSLAALTSLLSVAVKSVSVRHYGLLGFNCLWAADNIFYTLARRYTEYWLSGTLSPDEPLRRYLRGEAGALVTGSECGQIPAVRWLGRNSAYLVRAIQVISTRNAPVKFFMPDEEIAEWNREWDEVDNSEEGAVSMRWND